MAFMKYRILGKTGLRVSVVGIGTWQFGGEWGKDFEQPEVDAILDRAAELGVNLIDTAECYGDHTSERFIGRCAGVRQKRDRWIIATKFGHQWHGHMNRTEPRQPDDVRRQLDDSLRALQIDHIDLYQYHSWRDSEFFDDDVLAVLNQARDAGKIRHLGNSVTSKYTLEQITSAAERGVEAIQIVYNRLDRKPEQDGAFQACLDQHLGVLGRVPLASGYLSGKYGPADAAPFAASDVRASHDPDEVGAKLEQVEQIRAEEVPDGVNMASWALAWCLQHPAVTCVIPGCKDVGQVESNAAAAELELVAGDHPQAA
jgi:aryl-alcohol dehydrogenase-like predicted oxidoreductase